MITWLNVAPGEAICANADNAIKTTLSNASAVYIPPAQSGTCPHRAANTAPTSPVDAAAGLVAIIPLTLDVASAANPSSATPSPPYTWPVQL